MNFSDELRKLAERYQAGDITGQEFAAAKQRLIADSRPEPEPPALPNINAPMEPPSPLVKASIKKGSSIVGIGCAIQGLGLLCFVLGIYIIKTVVGPVILAALGVWLLFYGSRKASWFECSACGGKLAHGRVSLCPHCRSTFQ